MQFFDQLQIETMDAKAYLLGSPIIHQVLQGDFTLQTYIAFLNQAYHHVKHTVPLLMLAGARLGDDRRELQRAVCDYITEEAGHEQWILDDIASCGYSRQHYAEGSAPFRSELMIAYLYDYVQRKNPVGIFGMVQVLEGTSATLAPEVASIVQKRLELPDSALSYLTTHGELDQEHIGYFEGVMNTVTDLADQRAIIQVANATYYLYGDVYREITAEAEILMERDAA